ncbi:MAG: hypothetical protein J1F32_01290 [Erysipelotrichales bacterium]|nr:hypothetical protein [Erysipelotrichales bacterium]
MDEIRIKKEMKELEIKLKYVFKDIRYLITSMSSIKKDSQYENGGLATVGDAILKAVIATNLYQEGFTTKSQITEKKAELENNKTLHSVVMNEGIINYAYNEYHFHKDSNVPDHEKVACGNHDPYIEAIIGAIYFDSNFDKTKKWINEWLIPLLKKYKATVCIA